MSRVDTAWLRMESPTNLMMITGVIALDDAVDFDLLRSVIRTRFLAFPRFRYRPVFRGGRAWWEYDNDFEITSHVRRTALAGDAGKVELQERVSELASTPLDKTKPLWQFHLVENHVGGPALISRIHHCYADGMALVQVLLSLTDTGREASREPVEPDRWQRRQAAESSLFQRLTAPARDGYSALQQLGRHICNQVRQVAEQPDAACRYVNDGGEIMAELAHSLSLSEDRPTRFKGPLGVRKQAAWTDPLDLEEVKAVGKALGVTVNDVLIACVTGALHRYLRDKGEDPEGLEIRATVPVNLRRLEHSRELGNHFGLVFLDLPLGQSHPLKRLWQVAENMTHLKNSKQATVSLGLLAVLGVAPSGVQKPALEMLSSKATTVLTNVPGPDSPLYLAGSRLRELMFWVPQSGNIGMGISLISYDGKVFCGLITNHRAVPDPERVVEGFRPEFENLLHLTMLLDDECARDTEGVGRLVHEWLDE